MHMYVARKNVLENREITLILKSEMSFATETSLECAIMRWTFFTVTIALALIVDQLRFSGQYRRNTIDAVTEGIDRVGKLVESR